MVGGSCEWMSKLHYNEIILRHIHCNIDFCLFPERLKTIPSFRITFSSQNCVRPHQSCNYIQEFWPNWERLMLFFFHFKTKPDSTNSSKLSQKKLGYYNNYVDLCQLHHLTFWGKAERRHFILKFAIKHDDYSLIIPIRQAVGAFILL